MTMFEKYVLPRWQRSGAKHTPSKSPFSKNRSWHKILAEHFNNHRTRYFNYKGRTAKTLDEWVVKRHDAKLDLYTKNLVSWQPIQLHAQLWRQSCLQLRSLLQTSATEATASTQPASLAKERQWFTDSTKKVSHVEDLKDYEVRYDGTEWTWVVGEPATDLDAIQSEINKVQSLRYGMPAFLSDHMAGREMTVSLFTWT